MTTSTLTPTVAPRLRAPRGGLQVGDRYYRPGVFLPESARPALEAVAAKAARVSTTSEIVVGINGFSYGIASLEIDPSIGTHAFLLMPKHKPHDAYHVHRSTEGEVCCTCPDFVFRRDGSHEPCKHGRRMIELGLTPSRPHVLPPFALRSTSTSLPDPWWCPTPRPSAAFGPTPAERAEYDAMRAERGTR